MVQLVVHTLATWATTANTGRRGRVPRLLTPTTSTSMPAVSTRQTATIAGAVTPSAGLFRGGCRSLNHDSLCLPIFGWHPNTGRLRNRATNLRLVIRVHAIIKSMKKTGQLIFIDDSGDPGFKGATSNNFIMASAVFIDSIAATEVNKAISDFRQSLGWKEEAEFKFRKTNKQLVKQLLRIVCQYHFEVYAVYVDKSSYERMLPVFDREKLYNWTVKELLYIIPMHEAFVKIDGRSSREHKLRVKSYLRHEINVGGHKIKSIKTEDSTKDNLIQLADLIAGAINRSMQPCKTDAKDYLAILSEKVAEIRRLDLKNK